MVDDSFGPSSKATSVLYCRLTDFKSSSFSLLYPTNWKTETEKKFDSCKYNSLKTFLNRFIFGVYSELRHLSFITLLGVFQRSCLRRLQFQRLRIRSILLILTNFPRLFQFSEELSTLLVLWYFLDKSDEKSN